MLNSDGPSFGARMGGAPWWASMKPPPCSTGWGQNGRRTLVGFNEPTTLQHRLRRSQVRVTAVRRICLQASNDTCEISDRQTDCLLETLRHAKHQHMPHKQSNARWKRRYHWHMQMQAYHASKLNAFCMPRCICLSKDYTTARTKGTRHNDAASHFI